MKQNFDELVQREEFVGLKEIEQTFLSIIFIW